ncbi:monocarboxylate transporter 9-like [Saccoglossus kowalevskii]
MNEKKPCSVEEPPDGGYGWVILVSSMAIAFICGGNFYNCGIFLVSFVEHFQQGTAQVSLIGSISSALYVSSGLLANPLCKRFGVRIVVMVAGSISTVGVILSIFTPSLMFLYFSYGVLVGWLYDTSGTFNTPFLVAGGVLVCSGIMVLLASRMKTRLEYGPFSPRDYEVQIWRNP